MIFSIIEILYSFLIIFSYPELLQDHILSLLKLPHRQSIHTDILFSSTVFLIYGTIFLMPSCKSSSLIYSMLLYVIFFFDCFLFIYFGCFCVILCSCMFVLSIGSMCSYVCIYVCMYVGQHGCRFIICITL